MAHQRWPKTFAPPKGVRTLREFSTVRYFRGQRSGIDASRREAGNVGARFAIADEIRNASSAQQ